MTREIRRISYFLRPIPTRHFDSRSVIQLPIEFDNSIGNGSASS